MSAVHGEGLDSHWPFVKKFALGGMAFQDLGVWTQCPAPNVLTFCSTEYELGEAERQGGMVVAGITGGGEVPLWIHNQFPSSMMQPSPTSLLGAWGGAAAAGRTTKAGGCRRSSAARIAGVSSQGDGPLCEQPGPGRLAHLRRGRRGGVRHASREPVISGTTRPRGRKASAPGCGTFEGWT